MKSLLKFALLLMFVVIGYTGCIGPQGPPGENGWAYIDVRYYDVSRWTLDGSGKFYYFDVPNPAITNFVLDKGVVMGYLVENFNTQGEIQIPLPYDMYRHDDGVLWTETLSFDLSLQLIRFYFEPSDFYTGEAPPPFKFKIVTMW